MGSKEQDIDDLQVSIEQSKVAKAASLSMAEKFRLGADLYDDAILWLTLFIKSENPGFDDLQVDAEIERRKKIARRMDEEGFFGPYFETETHG